MLQFHLEQGFRFGQTFQGELVGSPDNLTYNLWQPIHLLFLQKGIQSIKKRPKSFSIGLNKVISLFTRKITIHFDFFIDIKK